MTAALLSDLMTGRTAMDATTLQELVQLAGHYPYFQVSRLLYLKNLSELRSVRYAEELHRNAVYMPDRVRLFTYLDHGEYAWSQHLQKTQVAVMAESKTAPDSFSLIDNYLRHTDEEPYPEQLEDLLPKLDDEQNNDYIHTLLDKPDIEPLPSDSQQSIIDSFIAKDEVGEVRLPLEDLQPEPQKTTGKEDALIKEDAFLTESLAKIYIKQKKYSKALEIIKKLSLKYPEKNVYFADQIRFLEKIITNIKTE
ncbi:MAG: hypothetical protein RR212_10010 [Bacteroidales bacterium]